MAGRRGGPRDPPPPPRHPRFKAPDSNPAGGRQGASAAAFGPALQTGRLAWLHRLYPGCDQQPGAQPCRPAAPSHSPPSHPGRRIPRPPQPAWLCLAVPPAAGGGVPAHGRGRGLDRRGQAGVPGASYPKPQCGCVPAAPPALARAGAGGARCAILPR